MDEELGTAAEGGVRDGVEVADDDVGFQPDLEQGIGATVDRDENRLEVPDVRADDAQVALVPGPAGDDDSLSVPEAGRQRRELDPVREQPAFLAQVPQRVVRKRLERLRDATLLIGERR